MEITYASPSAGDLLRSSTAASGSTMPTPRTIKIIPLQHPDMSSYGTPGGFGNNYSSSSLWPNSWISRYRGKIKRMTFIDWIEMFLPCCRWIRTYRWREYFQVDLMAGTTVGIMLVPQAMSYAKLAGLEPIYGLYSGFVPIFIYAIFGSSRQLAIGPVALVSLLVSNVLSGIAESSDALYTELAILLALMVGILECIMGLLRLGWLIRFISHSVISGFTTASAVVIALSQAKYFLGYDIDRSSKIVPVIKSIIAGSDEFSWPPFVMGSTILAIIQTMKFLGKSRKHLRFLRAMGPLTAVVLGTTFVKIYHPSSITLVGDIPQGLPSFSIPKSFQYAKSLISTAVLITGVAILESVGIAKALAAKNGYELDSNQELFGLGVANIFGSFFSAYPTTGSFSRSAVNHESGAKTGLSGIISGTIMCCALLFLTPLFEYIPQFLGRKLIMEKGFVDKVEDNAAVRIWAETTQREKGDSLTEGYVSELWDFTRISVIQNDLREMKEVWDQWDVEAKELFYCNYGDLPYLLSVKVDKYLFRALAQFWNPAYSCFTFGKVDLTPTVEEYTTLLRCPKIQVDKAYSRAACVPPLLKKLMNITGMSEQWVAARIQQKGDSKCVPWKSLRDLVLVHPDLKKRVDVFALGIYGLVVFPKALGHIDEAVSDLFDRLGKGVTPVPAILAETFRSLNACRKAGEGRFIGCAQLLLAWFHSHFWKVEKVSYRVFSDSYSPLGELVATPRRDDISEEKWIEILQNLQDEDIEWRAPWLIPDEILYRCGDFDWVPLLGIWGAIGYAPLLVSRQYRSRQFIPATQGLAYSDFSYREDNYKKKVREISSAWNQTRRMKILAVGPTITPEYGQWRNQRINDNIPASNSETARSLEEHLQVLPSEIEIIKQEFEKRSLELGKKIEQLEEEKMQLGLDVDIQRLEANKLRKGKNKAEEDLDSLKTDYKKLRKSVRAAGLGKTPEQWRQEIQEEKTKANQWEKKFQDARAREAALGRSLLVCQDEKTELKVRITELERSLRQYCNRNTTVELRASLDKIEELKTQIGGLENALQNSEIRIELLEESNEQWQGQFRRSQEQIGERDYIMGEAVTQVREVADHLQTLAVQADLLSLKYESESDRGRELAWLLRKVKALSVRAKPYM